MICTRMLGGWSLVLAMLGAMAATAAAPPTVGIEGRLETIIPGAKLVPRPLAPKAKIIVRVAAAFPYGNAYRYDLRYSGMVPGAYDLRDYLVREDGSTTNDLPQIPVTITPLLPKQHDGVLVREGGFRFSAWFRYRVVAGVVVALWALLLVPLVLIGRPKKPVVVVTQPVREPTLADLLRPLIERALEGKLGTDGQAELEHLLLLFWRSKLGLAGFEPAAAIAQLRQHKDAGALLASLDAWLYEPPGRHAVDIPALLAPYRDAVLSTSAGEVGA